MTGLMLSVYDEFKKEEGVNEYLAANVEIQNTVAVPLLVLFYVSKAFYDANHHAFNHDSFFNFHETGKIHLRMCVGCGRSL